MALCLALYSILSMSRLQCLLAVSQRVGLGIVPQNPVPRAAKDKLSTCTAYAVLTHDPPHVLRGSNFSRGVPGIFVCSTMSRASRPYRFAAAFTFCVSHFAGTVTTSSCSPV